MNLNFDKYHVEKRHDKRYIGIFFMFVVIAVMLALILAISITNKMTGQSIFDKIRELFINKENNQEINQNQITFGPNVPHVFYNKIVNFGTPFEENQIYHAYLDTNGWHSEQIFKGYGLGGYGLLFKKITSKNNIPHIAAVNNMQIVYITRDDSAGQFKSEVVVKPYGDYLTINDIAIDSRNRPYIIYTNCTGYLPGRNCDLRFSFKNDSGNWIDFPIHIEGDVGFFASMDFDSTDKMHIAYWESYFDGSIGGAWWYTTGRFGSWQKEKLWEGYLPNLMVGLYNSLIVDKVANIVHISHVGRKDSGLFDLRYMYNDGVWHEEVVVPMGTSIHETEIRLNNNHQPIIFYKADISTLNYATKTEDKLDKNWIIETVYTGTFLPYDIDMDNLGKPHIVLSDFVNPIINDDDKIYYFTKNSAGQWVSELIVENIQTRGKPFIYIENR
jgi:hypothetical protein